jgi:phosphatidylserine/phosphatidylglycerophosphate/cardiolipin synthase-like enzyme
MAKRSRSSGNKKGSPTSRLLMLLLLILIVAVAYAMGIDLNELGVTTESTPAAVEVTPTVGEWYELYFTQPIHSNDESRHTGSTAEQALIRSIDAAQTSIDAALFELNVPDTTAALVRAAERGVKIRVVADDEHNFDDPTSLLSEVIDAGAEAISDERSALMHNKYFIIDAQTLWMGSMNITRNDIYNNNNHYFKFVVPQLVANYQADFDEMFVDGAFSDRDDTRPVPNPVIVVDGTRIENFYSPDQGEEIEARLEELIRASQSSIHIMTFSFTIEELGDALLEQHTNGVDIKGVFENTGSLQGQMPRLACAGIEVHQDGSPDKLHHKVMIFDESIVVVGSLNFSASARDNNSENTLIIHNPQIAQAFLTEWQAIYDAGVVPTAEELACP